MPQATQVLEFGLGEESYCLDIAYIDEIVDAGELTIRQARRPLRRLGRTRRRPTE